MDSWFFKTNLVCSPLSENIDNGWMMMMMIKTTMMVVVVVMVALVVVVMMTMITIMNDDDDDDDDDDNDESSFLSRVLMKMETNGIPYLRFILEITEACSFAHIYSALT